MFTLQFHSFGLAKSRQDKIEARIDDGGGRARHERGAREGEEDLDRDGGRILRGRRARGSGCSFSGFYLFTSGARAWERKAG